MIYNSVGQKQPFAKYYFIVNLMTMMKAILLIIDNKMRNSNVHEAINQLYLDILFLIRQMDILDLQAAQNQES